EDLAAGARLGRETSRNQGTTRELSRDVRPGQSTFPLVARAGGLALQAGGRQFEPASAHSVFPRSAHRNDVYASLVVGLRPRPGRGLFEIRRDFCVTLDLRGPRFST